MIVLDTHAWIWWLSQPSSLSRKARARIDQASALGVPAISLWEVAMLVARGRIELLRDIGDWLEAATSAPKIEVLALTPAIAAKASQIDLHGDPADRLIVATAIVHGSPVVTKDERIRRFDRVDAVW